MIYVINMQEKEIKDLAISAIVLAFVFAYSGIGNLGDLVISFPISLLVISLGFILHEMGHRQIAKRFNCYAEFRLWKNGLLLALVLTFVTNGNLVFAAPGAVMIYPRADLWGRSEPLSRRGSGLISVAGPVTNLILAGIFVFLGIIYPVGLLGTIFYLGARINTWLALFNLIPFPPLDGSKILAWDIRIWAAMFISTIILFASLGFL